MPTRDDREARDRHCAITRGSTDQIGPPFIGNCSAGNVASFTDVIGDHATISVTNTFVAPTPPPGLGTCR